MTNELRLQRFLAQAGVASRRKAEELILAGRVRVNGRVVKELGTRVDPHKDQVQCDGVRVQPEELVWIILNKPPEVVCSAGDPEGRETVFDIVGKQGARLFSVGRLDFHTAGLLLLTNDGELAHALAHPSSRVPRVYHVKVKGRPSEDQLEALRRGVSLEGRMVKAKVAMLAYTDQNTWVEMVLESGLNHQIHRMMDEVGARVLKIIRIAFGPITVEGLRPGRYRSLKQNELNDLREAAGLPLRRREVRGTSRGRRSRPRSVRSGGGSETARPAVTARRGRGARTAGPFDRYIERGKGEPRADFGEPRGRGSAQSQKPAGPRGAEDGRLPRRASGGNSPGEDAGGRSERRQRPASGKAAQAKSAMEQPRVRPAAARSPAAGEGQAGKPGPRKSPAGKPGPRKSPAGKPGPRKSPAGKPGDRYRPAPGKSPAPPQTPGGAPGRAAGKRAPAARAPKPGARGQGKPAGPGKSGAQRSGRSKGRGRS